MGRRIRWLGVILVACLGLVAAQLVNIQLVKAKALQTSPFNPRVAVQRDNNPRGTIYAADGTVLAQSVRTPSSVNSVDYPYHYVREYPQGPLYAGITGYDSALFYGTTGIEEQYDSYLGPHQKAPQTLSQLLFRQNLPQTTDDVTLTVEPSLQNAAWQALTTLPPGDNKDGAVVVIQPSTGNILAMVSNPTFDPNALVSTSLQAEQLAHLSYAGKDREGFQYLQPIATGYAFAPGSTMKVVTSTAAYNLKPSLASFNYPVQKCQSFPDAPGYQLCDQSGPCGGTMTVMLPQSCDPGYAELGVQLGVPIMTRQAELFGYNSVPGIDLPGVVKSVFPDLPGNSTSHLGQSAIGQFDVQATALQNAMVAAGIANGGVMMTPHLMSSIHDSQGALVTQYTPKPAATVASPGAAAGDLAHGGRDHEPERDRRRRRFPLVPVRRRQDRHGADRIRGPRCAHRHLDDRLRPGEPPPDRGGGRGAVPVELPRRRPGGGTDREPDHASRPAAGLGLPALHRAAATALRVRPAVPGTHLRRLTAPG